MFDGRSIGTVVIAGEFSSPAHGLCALPLHTYRMCRTCGFLQKPCGHF